MAISLVVLQAFCCTLGADFAQALTALAIAFFACFVLLLVGRRVTGWSMHHGEGAGVLSENGRYGVRYLMGLTTFVALLAGLAKATDVWGQFESEVMLAPSQLAEIVLILVLLTVPAALLFIVTLMTGPHLTTRLFVVILSTVVAILLMMAVRDSRGLGSGFSDMLETAAVLFGVGATVGFSAAMFRWAGYRVGRKPGNSEVSGGGNLEEAT